MGKMINYYVLKNGIVPNEPIPINGDEKIKIDITEIYEFLPCIRYELECFCGEYYFKIRHFEFALKQENDEVSCLITFNLPKNTIDKYKAVTVNLLQVSVDENYRKKAIYYSFPMTFFIN